MRIFLERLAVLVVLSIVAGLAIYRGGRGEVSALHPSLMSQTLAPLIPVGDFLANTDSKRDYRPSPQGKWMSWKSMEWLATVIRVKPLNADGPVYTFLPEQGVRCSWDFDGEHLLIQQSRHGWDGLWKIRVDAPDANREEITPRGFNNWHIFTGHRRKGIVGSFYLVIAMPSSLTFIPLNQAVSGSGWNSRTRGRGQHNGRQCG